MRDVEQQLREIADPDASDTYASTETKLLRMRRIREALDSLTNQEVRSARRMGLTWDQIGECLGVTRQAAHKRYHHRPDTPDELATDPSFSLASLNAQIGELRQLAGLDPAT